MMMGRLMSRWLLVAAHPRLVPRQLSAEIGATLTENPGGVSVDWSAATTVPYAFFSLEHYHPQALWSLPAYQVPYIGPMKT